jgi:thaumarchaeosortase
MSTTPQIDSRFISAFSKLIPLLAFSTPFIILYYLYPDSFELMWKGRTFYLFFLWLILMELILNWDKIGPTKIRQLKSVRTLGFIAAIILPFLYILAANCWGLNMTILNFGTSDIAKYINMPNEQYANIIVYLPLSVEYLVFTVLFVFLVSMYFGREQLGIFSLSTVFIGVIGMIYTIDTLFPYGRFSPFQMIVPTTTMLAADILNMMGFSTLIITKGYEQYGMLTTLNVTAQNGANAAFNIAWVCSGIESLLIYSIVILLFLKNTAISLKQKIMYFAVGAGITYFINALRIATIFIIAINEGVNSNAVQTFHNFTGQFYSISWIMVYPLIILASRSCWSRRSAFRTSMKQKLES